MGPAQFRKLFPALRSTAVLREYDAHYDAHLHQSLD
jgi:hypothetical protein